MSEFKTKTSIHKVSRTKHPNDIKYPGFSTYDHNLASINFYGSLTAEQQIVLGDEDSILDVARLDSFMKSVQNNDIVGIENTAYKVLDNNENNFRCLAHPYKITSPKKSFSRKDLDVALGMGFCEILYRDDKPYGVSDTVNVKIVEYIVEKSPTEGTTSSMSSSENEPVVAEVPQDPK